MIKVNEFTDVKYDVSDSIATITINRPDRYNALRGRTVDELLAAFKYAWVDNSVGAIILTDRKSTRLNSSHMSESRMPSSA